MTDALRGTARQAPHGLNAEAVVLWHLDGTDAEGRRTLLHAPLSVRYSVNFFFVLLSRALPLARSWCI